MSNNATGDSAAGDRWGDFGAEVAGVLRAAQDEANRLRASAADDADRTLADARREAADLLDRARQEAAAVTGDARGEAARLLEERRRRLDEVDDMRARLQVALAHVGDIAARARSEADEAAAPAASTSSDDEAPVVALRRVSRDTSAADS